MKLTLITQSTQVNEITDKKLFKQEICTIKTLKDQTVKQISKSKETYKTTWASEHHLTAFCIQLLDI